MVQNFLVRCHKKKQKLSMHSVFIFRYSNVVAVFVIVMKVEYIDNYCLDVLFYSTFLFFLSIQIYMIII